MFKKILSALICSVICCCLIGFAACGATHEHAYTDKVVEPTCITSGYTLHTCSCGHSYTDAETNALGHDYKDVVTNPTCTEQGYTTHACSRCSDSYVDSYKAAIGHEFGEWTLTTQPTCTEAGVETRYCSHDNTHTETRSVNALGHDYKWTTTKAPTETTKGEEKGVCSRCNDETTRAIPETIHVHDYQESVTAPTCTEKGYTTYTCSCGASYKGNEVNALGHDYNDVITNPTCTEQGYITHTCSRCKDSKVDTYTAALGHNYVDGVCSRCQGIDPAYHAPTDFEIWLDSDDAEDFDGDRNITEADFEIYKAYIAWKASTNARDYDGDGNINYADYELSISGEDWVTWLNSAEAYDYNKDGRTDRNDYAIYLERKAVVGKYVIEDFDYEINSTEYTIKLLDSSYGIQDLKEDAEGFKLEISKDLKLTCNYDATIKAKLGEDETDVQAAINSCVVSKMSDTVTKVAFTLQNVNFNLYLTKTETGFTSSLSVTIDGVQLDVSFNLVYDK